MYLSIFPPKDIQLKEQNNGKELEIDIRNSQSSSDSNSDTSSSPLANEQQQLGSGREEGEGAGEGEGEETTTMEPAGRPTGPRTRRKKLFSKLNKLVRNRSTMIK